MLERRNDCLIDPRGMPPHRRADATRSLPGHHADQTHWIGTGVQECAARESANQPDIVRVRHCETESSLHCLHSSYRAAVDQLLKLQRMRLRPVREALDQVHAMFLRGAEHIA